MAIQGVSFTGLNAIATLMDGNGLGDYGLTVGSKLNGNTFFAKILEMHGAVKGDSTTATDDVAYDELTDIDPAVYATLQTFGNNREFGSGAFTAVVPGPNTSTLGAGLLHDSVQAHTSRLFGANALYMVQAIQNAIGIVENSRSLQPVLSQVAVTNFGSDPAENDVTAYNSNQYYLGNKINNPIDMVLNGYNSLANVNSDIGVVAQQFIDLGTAFDVGNPGTFGNPGQLCQAIAASEFASLIQLDVALINQGLTSVEIEDLDQAQYNQQCTQALAEIVNPEAVRLVKEMLNINNTQIVKLVDVTNFDKLFPNNSVLVANTLEELQQDLLELELGEFETSLDFGNFLATLLVPSMPTRGNENRPTLGNSVSTISDTFLFRNASLNLSDILGSVGGIEISDSVTAYRNAMDTLYNEGTLTNLYNAAQDVIDAAGATYIAPNTKTDAVNNALDDFTTELNSLISKENINSTITTAIESWQAVSEKCTTEKNIEAKFNLYLSDRTGDSNFAVGFINSIDSLTENTSDRQFLLGLSSTAVEQGDASGEYLNAYISESVNYRAITNNQARFAGGVQR